MFTPHTLPNSYGYTVKQNLFDFKCGRFLCGLLFSVLLLFTCEPVAAGDNDEIITKLKLDRQWTGDFDGMVEERLVRVLVVHNKMLFFIDQGRHRGANVDLFGEFEKFINQKTKAGTRKIRVLFIPVPRDQLFTALIEGRGDIAAANLTITPKRKQRKFLVPAGTT